MTGEVPWAREDFRSGKLSLLSCWEFVRCHVAGRSSRWRWRRAQRPRAQRAAGAGSPERQAHLRGRLTWLLANMSDKGQVGAGPGLRAAL